MGLFNQTTELGQIFYNFTIMQTGSYYISFLAIFFLCLFIFLVFGLPLEFSVPALFIISLLCLLLTGEGALIGLSLLFISIILAKLLPS
jgi:hypothetical protein